MYRLKTHVTVEEHPQSGHWKNVCTEGAAKVVFSFVSLLWATLYSNHNLGYKEVHTFSKSICSKMNEIAWLVVKLAYLTKNLQPPPPVLKWKPLLVMNVEYAKRTPVGCHHYHHPHHHYVVLLARISLTLSRHFSLSFIASGRSSLVSSHSCCMYVRAGRPAFAWSYAGVHRSTSLMSSSLLLQQFPACLVRLTCIVFVMGGRSTPLLGQDMTQGQFLSGV